MKTTLTIAVAVATAATFVLVGTVHAGEMTVTEAHPQQGVVEILDDGTVRYNGEILLESQPAKRVKRGAINTARGRWVWDVDRNWLTGYRRVWSNYYQRHGGHAARVSIGNRSTGWNWAPGGKWAYAEMTGNHREGICQAFYRES